MTVNAIRMIWIDESYSSGVSMLLRGNLAIGQQALTLMGPVARPTAFEADMLGIPVAI